MFRLGPESSRQVDSGPNRNIVTNMVIVWGHGHYTETWPFSGDVAMYSEHGLRHMAMFGAHVHVCRITVSSRHLRHPYPRILAFSSFSSSSSSSSSYRRILVILVILVIESSHSYPLILSSSRSLTLLHSCPPLP